MENTEHNQPELDLGSEKASPGYERWRADRRAAMAALARNMGMPLGREVEVWLQDGVCLKGVLRLAEERLFVNDPADQNLVLIVDGTSFTTHELESCVRLD